MGIRNSYSLINKIELVEKGMSKDKLLDTYQIECYPDFEYIIKQSLFMGGLLFNTRFYVNFVRGLIHFLMEAEVNQYNFSLNLFQKQLQYLTDSIPISTAKRISHVQLHN